MPTSWASPMASGLPAHGPATRLSSPRARHHRAAVPDRPHPRHGTAARALQRRPRDKQRRERERDGRVRASELWHYTRRRRVRLHAPRRSCLDSITTRTGGEGTWRLAGAARRIVLNEMRIAYCFHVFNSGGFIHSRVRDPQTGLHRGRRARYSVRAANGGQL